ncbi:MAG: hypothetical protein IPK22_26645 [Verrucomicrobiaceae bacterium]|nr:hypothetical protein [Verrucomicrobiaceae bacterium]
MKWSKHSFFEGLKILGLEPSLAEFRAGLLVEALDWIEPKDFKLYLEPAWLSSNQERPVPLLEYSIGDILSGRKKQFDIDNADSPDDDRHTSVSGSGLSQFPLLWFVKVIEAAKERLPHLWLKCGGMRSYLRRPLTHVAKLNEIWWLNRFLVTDSVVADYPLVVGTDVDWRFRVPGVCGNDFWVNLEVKHRVSDVIRAVRFDEERNPHVLSDIIHKFRPSKLDELNVAGITVFGAIDEPLIISIREWLNRNPAIDGIILSSHDGMNGPDFVGLVRSDSIKPQVLDSILVQPDSEDRRMIRRYNHVLPRSLLPPELSGMWPEK